jgi:hypothetical protein
MMAEKPVLNKAAISAATAAKTAATNKAAAAKAFKGYQKDQKNLQKNYDPYLKMYGRLMPAMEQSYMTGLSSVGDLLTSVKANRELE